MKQILLIGDSLYPEHSTSWVHVWKASLKDRGVPFEFMNWNDTNVLDAMDRADAILHPISHFSTEELKISRQLLIAAHLAGKAVFPSLHDLWHFDDKVAQSALFKFTKQSHPKTVLLLNNQVADPLGGHLSLPVVNKLRGGSGSYNVTKVTSQDQLNKVYHCMFSQGLQSKPKVFFKIWSAIKSVRSPADFFNKLLRARDFRKSYSVARHLPAERNYLYLQDYVAGATFDLKIVIVNNKLGYLCRHIRSNDFRASGSNDIYYDQSLISDAVIETCVAAFRTLNMTCAGFDVVVDPNTDTPSILEVSYGFSHKAILDCGVYFDLGTQTWVDQPLDVPVEILKVLDLVA